MDVAKASTRAPLKGGHAALRMELKPEPVDFEAMGRGLEDELLGLEGARKRLHEDEVDSGISVRLTGVTEYRRRLQNEPGMPEKGVPTEVLMNERELAQLFEESVPFIQSNARGTFQSHSKFSPYVKRYNRTGGEIVQYAFRERDGITHKIEYAFGMRLMVAEFGRAAERAWQRWKTDNDTFRNSVRPLTDAYELDERELKLGGSVLDETYSDASKQYGIRLVFQIA